MTHTAQSMIPAVGQTVLLKVDDLRVECIVMDAKNSWGNVRVQISPKSGTGAKWVELSSLALMKQPAVPAWVSEARRLA